MWEDFGKAIQKNLVANLSMILWVVYNPPAMWLLQKVFRKKSLHLPSCYLPILTVVSRPDYLSEWDTATMLQGVLLPGEQTKADFWGCQEGLQVRRRWAAQHWNRKRAAADREVHTKAAAWRWRLLDWAPSQPTGPQGRDHKPRLLLPVLLVGWKQGWVQVFLSFSKHFTIYVNVFYLVYQYISVNVKSALNMFLEKGCSQLWLGSNENLKLKECLQYLATICE